MINCELVLTSKYIIVTIQSKIYYASKYLYTCRILTNMEKLVVKGIIIII